MSDLQSKPAPRKPFDAARYVSNEPGRLVVDGFRWEPEPRQVVGHRLDPWHQELVALRRAGWTLSALIILLEAKAIRIDESELSKYLIRNGVRKIAPKREPLVFGGEVTDTELFALLDSIDLIPEKDFMGRTPSDFIDTYYRNRQNFVGRPEHVRLIATSLKHLSFNKSDRFMWQMQVGERFLRHEVCAHVSDDSIKLEILKALFALPSLYSAFTSDVLRLLREKFPDLYTRAKFTP